VIGADAGGESESLPRSGTARCRLLVTGRRSPVAGRWSLGAATDTVTDIMKGTDADTVSDTVTDADADAGYRPAPSDQRRANRYDLSPPGP